MALGSESPALPATQTRAGSPGEVWSLAYPVVVTQISATLMGVVDAAMVGRLGPTQLAAAGFSGIWLWTVFSLFYGTASGVQTFVSQHDGAGHSERCGGWAWHGFWVVVPAVALTVACLLPAVDALLALLGPSQELQTSASVYMRARLPGEVGVAMWMVFASFFRGIGDTRTPMYVGIGANLMNAVLDYGLIFGRLGLPEWGIEGAGIATAVAMWASGVTLLVLFRRRALAQRYGTRMRAPSSAEARRFLRTGAPMGGQWFIGMTSFAVFTTVVARMGDESMAASQALVILLSLSFMQAIGISVASQTLVGRYKGARRPEAVRRSFTSSLVLGIVLAAGVALLFVSIPDLLLRIFTDDASVVALGRPLLLIGALFQLCDAVAIISEGALRGTGDTRWPFLAQTALGWGVFVPLAYTLGVVLELGLAGAWAGGCFSLAILAVVLVRRFRSGAWEGIQI